MDKNICLKSMQKRNNEVSKTVQYFKTCVIGSNYFAAQQQQRVHFFP